MEADDEEVCDEFDENPSYLEIIMMKSLCKIKRVGTFQMETLD